MWRILAISMCLLEKYLANMMTKASLAKSDGWNENAPKSNQLAAPCDTLPTRKSADKSAIEPMNKTAETEDKRRNLTSAADTMKKTATETAIQMNWCQAKELSPVKECIVANPAASNGNVAKNKTQSILNQPTKPVTFCFIASFCHRQDFYGNDRAIE